VIADSGSCNTFFTARADTQSSRTNLVMNTKDFIRLGIPLGEATRRAPDFVRQFILSGGDKTAWKRKLKAIVANPSAFREDPLRRRAGQSHCQRSAPAAAEPVKYRQWGEGWNTRP
jgi:hypothetical protein